MTTEEAPSAEGLRTFYGFDELRRFGNTLLTYYEAKVDYYNQKLGTLLRQEENNATSSRNAPPTTKGWIKVGTILVNVANPTQAMSEILFKLREEFKLKLAATKAFLDYLDSILNVGAKRESTYQVYLKNGVPERIIVEETKRNEAFKYSVRFQVIPD